MRKNPLPPEIAARHAAAQKRAHNTDVHIGNEIRRRRKLAGMSQTELGHELGVTFQQIQKYGLATNRISPGRLDICAEIFRCDIADFFPTRPDVLDMPVNSAVRFIAHQLMDLADELDVEFDEIEETDVAEA